MTRVKVKSSAIHELAYCRESKVLEITFTGGNVHRYFDVPSGLVDKFLSAPSHGRFFNTFIARSFGGASVGALPAIGKCIEPQAGAIVSSTSCEALHDLIPSAAFDYVASLIQRHRITVTVTAPMKKRHGEYHNSNGAHMIRMSENPNQYRFLITLIHEIAHALAWEEFRGSVRSHGPEWKSIYRSILMPLTGRSVFPRAIDHLVIKHCNRPKSATDKDTALITALTTHFNSLPAT